MINKSRFLGVLFLICGFFLFNINICTSIEIGIVESGISYVVKQSTYEVEKGWSENQINNLIEENCKWCSDGDYCYALGYVKDGRYCGIFYDNFIRKNKIMFINQTEIGGNCTQNFECKSNLCSNLNCIDGVDVIIFSLRTQVAELNLSLMEEREKVSILYNEINHIKEYLEKFSKEIQAKDTKETNETNILTGFFVKIFGI
jgi:hypothetical protein